MSCAKLGLGTVQWGMTYGVANRTGRPGADEVRRMLLLGREHGIRLLDTAYAYGDAQKVLGAQGAAAQGYQIVTKTKPLRVLQVGDDDVREIVTAFDESLTSLGVESVYGLLVHGAGTLDAPGAESLWSALETFKRQGRVARIGVSVYQPAQLQRILDRYPIDLVQLPFNVYDQRFKEQGLLRRLQGMRVEIHARSVFLQGLLLLSPEDLPPPFESLRPHHAHLHQRLRERGLTPIEGCLSYCLQQPEIGRIVVGCETADQLKDVLDASAINVPVELAELAEFGLLEEAVINPSAWVN